MRGINRMVNTSFWDDNKVIDTFTPEDKYFMLYLLTNPHTTQLGIYEFPIAKASFELGYTKESIIGLLDRFETKHGIIKYSKDTKEVLIKNFLRHSIVKGGKPVMDCLKKEESKVKDKSLLIYLYKYLDNYTEELNITVIDYINILKDKYKDNDIDNDNDNDNENERIVITNRQIIEKYTEEIKEIIDYINLILGTSYTYKNKTNNRHIKARLDEGHTVEEFKTVIDKMHRIWGNDSKMSQYLRPETLFGTKFEGYLNMKNVDKQESEKKEWLDKWGL